MAQRVCEKKQVFLRRRGPAGALLLTCLLFAAVGCEQTTKHVVVRQPASNPLPAPPQTPVAGSRLPEPSRVEVAAQPQATAPQISPVEQLARQVEAVFDSGEKEYKDGHLGAARQQFD